MNPFLLAWQNLGIVWWVILLWVAGYSFVNRLTKKRSVYLKLSFLDKKIPHSESVFGIFYLAGYVLPFYPIFVIEDAITMNMVMYLYAAVIIFSFIFFCCYPIKIKRPKPCSLILKIIRKYDLENNCFPSLHCALSTLPFLLGFALSLPAWPVTGVLGLGVVLSTFFTKQHYIIDSIGGVLVSFFFFSIAYVV